MMRSLKELNFNVEKEHVFNKKQKFISDFFFKQQMVMLSMYMCCVFDVFLLPYRLNSDDNYFTWRNFWYKENFWCSWPKLLIFSKLRPH